MVHIQWYATVLRQDHLAAEVAAVAPLSLRYGATQYAVHRSHDDRYRILQTATFRMYGRIQSTLSALAPQLARACLRLIAAPAATQS